MALTPRWGITEMPPGEHASRYPDLESEKLVGAIETEGARLAWSRAADCPCQPINTQTKQPDPNCPLCKGLGVIYFGPRNYVPPAEAGTLTPVQTAILAVDGAAIIRGVVARATSEADLYDVLGRWVWGVMLVSVRPENKIGYYDRLVSLDSEMCFFQSVTAKAGVSIIPLRYLVTGVNLVRSLTTIYDETTDWVMNDDGTLTWATGQEPTRDTLISVHYTMHPTWLVIDHPHVIREIGRRKPRPALTPLGTPTALPLQGRMKLEFLPIAESP